MTLFRPVLISFLFFATVSTTVAQHRFGVRAGLNFATFQGELEVNENYDFATGFHFGFNYTYQFAPNLGVRAELLYNQKGGERTFRDEAAFSQVLPIGGTPFFEAGLVDYRETYTFNYLCIPVTLQYDVGKFELFGGLSADILFGPRGGGTFFFQSAENPQGIIYELALDHNYATDRAGLVQQSAETTALLVDGTRVDIFRDRTAYLEWSETELDDRGKRFRILDGSLVAGVNYFINRGLYIGIRGELSFRDFTNPRMDFSLKSFDTASRIERDDKDRVRNIGVSFGFRF